MGVYIKKVQAKKLEVILKMLGLNINEGDIIEIKEPHGKLIDADKTWTLALRQVENMPPELEMTEREKDIALAVISGVILQTPTVIEAEVE